MSFREFLAYEGVADIAPVPLEELLSDHVRIAASITKSRRILPLFDRSMIMKSGRVMCRGERMEVFSEANLREAFGMPVRVVHNRSGRVWAVLDD